MKESLTFSSPKVYELAQDLTELSANIQEKLLKLIDLSLRELQRSANIDIADLIEEPFQSSSLELTIRRRLDKHRHMISTKTRVLIADIGVLERLTCDLIRYDATSLHLLAENIKREATQNQAVPKVKIIIRHFLNSHLKSTWMMTANGDSILKIIKDRVYRIVKASKNYSCKASNRSWAFSRTGKPFVLKITQEENPKLSLLKQVLSEVTMKYKSGAPNSFGRLLLYSKLKIMLGKEPKFLYFAGMAKPPKS